jgi:hypothetical protein
MGRAMTGIHASMVAVLLISTAGCKADGGGTPSPPSSAAAMVITTAEAQRVFDRYDEVNAAADGALNATAIREVQTGVLLTESLATYTVHRKAGTKDTVVHYVRPTFLVPLAADEPAFPRYFAVLSKRKGDETDRASTILYFTQTQAAGHWKATAATWVVTDAVRTPTGPTPSAAPTPTPTGNIVKVLPKILPELRRTASGAVELSASADADRAICDDYAAYLTFSPPNGKTTNSRFTSGSFSSDLVKYYNGFWNPQLNRSYSVRATGERLPVFRFTNGGAFVACTFERRHRLAGSGASGRVWFDEGTDTDVLLGGGGRHWRSIQEISSFAALFEVPAGDASPATVLTSDAYGPDVLSATGARP